LKDILEQEVDEKFFLTQEKTDILLKTVNHDKETTSNDIKPMNDSKKIREQIGFESVNRFYDTEGIAPCLNTMGGGGREPKIMVVGNTSNTGYGSSDVYDTNGISTTIMSRDYKGAKQIMIGDRIRKLTPLECWRLQAFPDSTFRAAEQVNSNSQLYKQAGNSVTVSVIKAIAERL